MCLVRPCRVRAPGVVVVTFSPISPLSHPYISSKLHHLLHLKCACRCKLLVINKTLHERKDDAEWVVYMDSDAVFQNHFLKLDWVYEAAPKDSALILFNNYPFLRLTSRCVCPSLVLAFPQIWFH